MKKLLLGILLIGSVFLLFSCSTAPVSISPSTIPITSKHKVTELGETTGDAWGVMILGIPLSEPTPAKNARDRAINSKNADALIGVTCDSRMINLGPVAIFNAHVEGTAVKVSK